MYDRIVVVTRRTRLDELIARFNTRGQARFYIEHSTQGTGDFAEHEREHDAYERAVALVHHATDVGLPRHVIDRDLADGCASAVAWVLDGRANVLRVTLAEARLDDGQRLLAGAPRAARHSTVSR